VGLGIALIAGGLLVVARMLDGAEISLRDYARGDLWLDSFETPLAKGAFVLSLLISYGLTMIFFMWLATVVYFRRRHANLCAATSFMGLESLDKVRQRAAASQTESDGFADALDIGGL
jgi:hypothetical protein